MSSSLRVKSPHRSHGNLTIMATFIEYEHPEDWTCYLLLSPPPKDPPRATSLSTGMSGHTQGVSRHLEGGENLPLELKLGEGGSLILPRRRPRLREVKPACAMTTWWFASHVLTTGSAGRGHILHFVSVPPDSPFGKFFLGPEKSFQDNRGMVLGH